MIALFVIGQIRFCVLSINIICLLFKWLKMLPASCIRLMGSLICETFPCVRNIFIGAHNRLQRSLIYTYFGVGRNHPRMSLLEEMSCFPLMWNACLRYVVFWFEILLSPMFENRIIRREADDAISLSRWPWLNNLKDVLVQFRWSDV